MAIIKEDTVTNVGKDAEKREPYVARCSHCGKLWRVLRTLTAELPYDPATPLLGTSMKRVKTLIQKYT